jgi:hypothetical protein
MRRGFLACGLSALVAAACVIGSVSDQGKPCPCPPGGAWSCVRGVCEPIAQTDAGMDSAGSDSSPGDADAPTDAGPKSWCSQNAPDAFFCCDFDEDASLTSDWQFVDSGAITIDDGDKPPSPPLAMLVDPGGAIEGGYSAYVENTWLGNTATALHLSYDLYYSGFSTGAFVTTSQIDLSPNDAGLASARFLGLLVYPDKASLQEHFPPLKGGPQHTLDNGEKFKLGQWLHITLDVVLEENQPDAARATCVVTVNDASSGEVRLEAGWRAGSPTLVMGMPFSQGQPNPTVRIDNVTFDIH